MEPTIKIPITSYYSRQQDTDIHNLFTNKVSKEFIRIDIDGGNDIIGLGAPDVSIFEDEEWGKIKTIFTISYMAILLVLVIL